jgi:dihydrofolate reductase
MSQLVRVQNFCVSTDGFGAGDGQSLSAPFGHADRRGGRIADLPGELASWGFATAHWPGRTEPGGSRGLDDYFTRDFTRNIGAEIMGRNKFGPQRGPWENLDWTGWWGDTPPFHTPVFVLTHHLRPSFTLADTTFHFLDATPAEAVQRAKDAAEGPVPPRIGAEPERCHTPSLLAAVTTANETRRCRPIAVNAGLRRR